ncbi:PQQ-binding-like beta-propeller repeat protein [bacterium]|nr:PQQ-binding-like beta-propeller repeat protein [bacterium]
MSLTAADAGASPATLAEPAAAQPMDWPFCRGPEQNGISHEVGLVDKWSVDGENLIWSKPEFAGKSTPITMNGKLYTLVRHKPETTDEAEKVICVDLATGKLLWENVFNVFLSDVPDTRIGWSSVVGDPTTGRVYALGVCGYFQCIDGETGKTIWSHSMSEEFGLLTTYGGRTNFPFVFDDLVIISGVMIGWGEFARPNHRFIAFDKSTGKTIWFNATRPLPDDTTYSTPILGNFDGQLLFVVGAGDGGLYAMQPRTGKIVWKYQLSRRGVNGTPLIHQGQIFVTQAEEQGDIKDATMGAAVALPGNKRGEIKDTDAIWRIREIVAGRNQPLLVGDRLYVVDDGAGLFIFDIATGKLIKKQKLGTVMRGSLLYADGKIYACEANGRCWVFKPSAKGVDVLSKLQLEGEIQASPIVSRGKIIITSTEAMFCIGKKDIQPKTSGEKIVPLASVEKKGDDKVTLIQAVPVESLVRPGEKIDFETRRFNAVGQRLAAGKAEFSVDAAGKITTDGAYSADTNANHQASIISAKEGELTSQARVRIVGNLPWNFDFSDNEVPITWIGARYRHVPREVDGEKLIVKITTIPKGTRSQSWMGHADLHDYTIQADVRGSQKNGKMPDMGLIAQRYTLDLMGQNQQLGQQPSEEERSGLAKQQIQIRTWPPVLKRMGKTIPFEWKPDTWYTIKLQASNQGPKAILRGKVWPRGTSEPREWTIEAEDSAPNRTGSPGMYGNATNAEIFIDNVSVKPNKS